jgi:hypothetical protein
VAFKLSTSHDKKKKNKITCTPRKNPTRTFINKYSNSISSNKKYKEENNQNIPNKNNIGLT